MKQIGLTGPKEKARITKVGYSEGIMGELRWQDSDI